MSATVQFVATSPQDLKNEIEFLKNNREDTIEIRKDKRIIQINATVKYVFHSLMGKII